MRHYAAHVILLLLIILNDIFMLNDLKATTMSIHFWLDQDDLYNSLP